MPPEKPKGLRITSRYNGPVRTGDGVALTSMAHPPGLMEKMVDMIRRQQSRKNVLPFPPPKPPHKEN